MRALVKYGDKAEDMEVRDIEKPSPKAGEILIKIMAAGICGTDLHIVKGEFPCYPPVVPGHEFTGTIEELGEGVTKFKEGDQVVAQPACKTCGECYYCHNGLPFLCRSRKSFGTGFNGAMAEYMVIPAAAAYKVPDNMVGNIEMALSEPIGCCVRAVTEMTNIKAGDVVLISGPGTIGQMCAILAKLQGAVTIVTGLPSDIERLKLAKEMGADAVCSTKEEIAAALAKYTQYGADFVFECVGVAPSAVTCLEAVKPGGHYGQVGVYGKNIDIYMDAFIWKELSMSTNGATSASSWDRVIKLFAQNKLPDVSKLISAKLPLEDWQKAFDMAENREGYKIFLIP